MAQILPNFRIKSGTPLGNELFFQMPDLQDNPRAFLDSDANAGDTSLSANGVDFSANQYVIVGTLGQLKTEIAQISGSPTSTTITLVSGLKFSHQRGDKITFIPYNQITYETSPDNVTFTAQSAISIQPDIAETYQQRTADASTTYYRFRFNNGATFSPYSDVLQATGLADNSLGSIRNRSLRSIGEKISDNLTAEMLLEWLTEGRREVDRDQRILRWSFRQKFESILGQITPGTRSVNLPTDLRDPNTSANIFNFYIGLNKYPLTFQPKDIFEQNYLNMAHTTVKNTASAGATSITLANSGDFPIITSGTVSVTVSAQSVTGQIITLTYTTNTVATGVLSGIPASGAGSIPAGGIAAGSDVWYNINSGLPVYYMIDNGKAYFDMPFMNSLGGQNIYMDYYAAMSALVNDNSTVDEPEYDLYVSWLKWKIKYRKANGNIDKDTDPDYKEWAFRKDQLIIKEIADRSLRFFPG
jgi:hypothetical protein